MSSTARLAMLRCTNSLYHACKDVIATSLALLLLTVATAQAESYRNPILTGMNPDPSIVRTGEDYYLTTSTFEFFPGCALYHSRDLVHWDMIGYALDHPQHYSLSARSGYLHLYGQPDELACSHPTAFAGRRQTELKSVSTARLEFDPHVEGERAGLTAFMSPRYHYDVVKVLKGGKTFVQLVKHISDTRTIAAARPAARFFCASSPMDDSTSSHSQQLTPSGPRSEPAMPI